MKKPLWFLLTFIVGLALGIGGMLVVIQKGPTEVIRSQWQAYAAERVIYATLLNDQQYADLEKLLEQGMAASLYGMKDLEFNDQLKSSERLVKGFYDLSGSPIPSRLDPYLSGVKGVDVRKLASYAVKNSN